MKIFLLALVLTTSDAVVFRMDKVYNTVQACEVDGQEIINNLKTFPVPNITKVKLSCVTEEDFQQMMRDYKEYQNKQRSISI